MATKINTSLILKLLSELESQNILDSLFKAPEFYDEPKMYRYNAVLTDITPFSDGVNVETTASGFSFESADLALFKCLMESLERFATLSFRKKNFIYSSYKNLQYPSIDPYLYTENKDTREKEIGWSYGINFLTKQTTLIPAQVLYYNYINEEPHLTVQVSTGAAGGINKDETLLRGIYEIVERDSFMGIYLAKVNAPRINLSNLHHPKIKRILSEVERYNLEIMLFDISTDLLIPSYLAIVIDRTGLGPSISLGLKSSLCQEKAIIGCLEEALLTRPWMRNEIISKLSNQFEIIPKNLSKIRDRGLYWISPAMIKNLGFLINQEAKEASVIAYTGSVESELEDVKRILSKNNIQTYYADLTPDSFNKLGFCVYKVTMPELQPLYFQEKNPEIRKKRVTQIAHYFGKENYTLNHIPHPFL